MHIYQFCTMNFTFTGDVTHSLATQPLSQPTLARVPRCVDRPVPSAYVAGVQSLLQLLL